MTDPWDFWRRAQMAPELIGTKELPVHPDSPQIGYYRYFDKRADRYVPVAFFISDDADEILCCHEDGQPVVPMKMGDLWHRCCRYPISYLAYKRAVDGQGFADEPPTVIIGHNLSDDVAEQLRLEFEAEMEIVQDLLAKELDQDTADQVAIMSKRLSNIRQRADDEHTREKRPALEESRRIDDKWRFRDRVTESVTQLKKHLQPWLDTHEMSAGRTGARVSLRTFPIGFITDYDLFIENVKHRPDVSQFFEALATKLAKSGTVLGGMEIREERRAI